MVYVGPHTARNTQVGRRLASREPELPTLNPKPKAGVTGLNPRQEPQAVTHTRPKPKAGVTSSHTHKA